MTFLRLPGGSLHAKLLLLSLLLVVGPGIVFAWIATDSSRRALEHAVGRQLAEVAQDTSERVAGEITRLQTDVQSWAGQDVMQEVRIGDIDKHVSRLLVELERDNPSVLDLSATDRAGAVVAASDPALLGANVTERDWWGSVERGEQVIAAPNPVASGGGSLEIAAPIFDPDDPRVVIGALLATYRWETMTGILEHLQHDLGALGLEVSVLLLDGSGRVAAGGWWKEPSELIGQNLRDLGWVAAAPGNATRPAYLQEASADALVGYARITNPDLGWIALAVQPLSEAFAPVNVLRRNLLVALLGVLVIGLGLAAWIADRLSRPIRELTDATRELARTGEARAPVPVRSRDEIGDLATAFNRMAGDLTRAREDLLAAAKFAFVGELAAGMTHEIRTPLGILRSSAQILGRSVQPSDHRSAELVEMIISEVDRLDRVVAGLLELARPHEPLLESVSLVSVLSRTMDFVAGQAEERGISLRRDFSLRIRPARCDPEEIYRVALNLVINALQILPRGGAITVRPLAHDGRVGFEVSDDGPGIPPDDLDRIFTPFFTRRPGGTGLGLALVQRIVQSHHGSVTVKSEVGHGTTFRVELPAATEAA